MGRVVQYFNQRQGDQETLNFNDPSQNFIWSVYEGQIRDGIGHGFARIIYGDSGKSYTGYYEKGIKTGKGIQREKSGGIQAQGIWKDNEHMLRSETITSFATNVDVAHIEHQMEVQLLKDQLEQPNGGEKKVANAQQPTTGDNLLGLRFAEDGQGSEPQQKRIKLIYVPQEDDN